MYRSGVSTAACPSLLGIIPQYILPQTHYIVLHVDPVTHSYPRPGLQPGCHPWMLGHLTQETYNFLQFVIPFKVDQDQATSWFLWGLSLHNSYKFHTVTKLISPNFGLSAENFGYRLEFLHRDSRLLKCVL